MPAHLYRLRVFYRQRSLTSLTDITPGVPGVHRTLLPGRLWAHVPPPLPGLCLPFAVLFFFLRGGQAGPQLGPEWTLTCSEIL